MQGWLLLVGLGVLVGIISVGALALIARSESRPRELKPHGTAGRAMGAGFVNFDDFMRGKQPTAIVAQQQAEMGGEQEGRLGGAAGKGEDEPEET